MIIAINKLARQAVGPILTPNVAGVTSNTAGVATSGQQAAYTATILGLVLAMGAGVGAPVGAGVNAARGKDASKGALWDAGIFAAVGILETILSPARPA